MCVTRDQAKVKLTPSRITHTQLAAAAAVRLVMIVMICILTLVSAIQTSKITALVDVPLNSRVNVHQHFPIKHVCCALSVSETVYTVI